MTEERQESKFVLASRFNVHLWQEQEEQAEQKEEAQANEIKFICISSTCRAESESA